MPAASPTFVIIGAGFAGLCIAMRLKRMGIDSFVILEKEGAIGGTWRDNVYPGAACDIPSFHYCFSFEQRVDWSRKWAPQPEILDYIRHCAKRYDLERHIRLNTEVEAARFDGERHEWVVRTKTGDELRTQFLISAVGQLNRPYVPDVRGLSDFGGTWFHSARWKPEGVTPGKHVAVVGNAASAVQFIPQIAPVVGKLTVFQRSPNWMLPKLDSAYSECAKRWFTRLPFLAFLYRFWLWYTADARFVILLGWGFFQRLARTWATEHLQTQVTDPSLREKLLPTYPIGAKRILISDDYYPALTRENVRLVTRPIDHVNVDSIVTDDGEKHAVETIVFATGFQTTAFLVPMRIEDANGRTLDDAWRDGAEAYLGITVAGFPNFFMMYGPNTNLGHNSILFMLECQADYILGMVRKLRLRGSKSFELTNAAMRSYNDKVQKELGKTVWARISASWYKNASGRITNNWYGPTWLYWLRTRRIDLSAYRLE
jgi:cation diffusion facilitator CzcD-associated flavoprotein CzcO